MTYSKQQNICSARIFSADARTDSASYALSLTMFKANIITMGAFLCAFALCFMALSTTLWAQGLAFGAAPSSNNPVPYRIDAAPTTNTNASTAGGYDFTSIAYGGTSSSALAQQPTQVPLRPQTSTTATATANAATPTAAQTYAFGQTFTQTNEVNFGTTATTTNAGAASNFGTNTFTNSVATNVNTANNGFNNQLFAQQTGGSINPYNTIAANDYKTQALRSEAQQTSNSSRNGLPGRTTTHTPTSSGGGGGLFGSISGFLNIGGGIVSAAANIGSIAGNVGNAFGALGEGTGFLSNFANSGIGQGIQNGAQFVSTNASNFSNFAANPLAGVSGTGFANTFGITGEDITLAQQTLGTTSQVAGAAAAVGAFTGNDNAGNFALVAAGTGALSGGQTLNFGNTQGASTVAGAAGAVSNGVNSVQGAIDDSNIVEAAGHLGVNNATLTGNVSIAGTSPNSAAGGLGGLANSVQQSFTPPANAGINPAGAS